jgi:YggT family protein
MRCRGMEEIMHSIFGFLATLAGIYSILLFIRIIISWFGSFDQNKPVEILSRVTDPYLGWWRRNLPIRIGILDFSVVAAIVFLAVIQRIFVSIAASQGITLGSILAIVLLSVWGIVSFILGFCLVIIILRLIAYLTNRDIYSPFWQMVDSISKPVLYRLNRIIFGNRIVGFLKGIIMSSILLIMIWIGGNLAASMIANFLYKLPV